MITEEKFKELASEAYRKLQGMKGWRIHIFEDGELSEPVTGGTSFYNRSEDNSDPTEYVIRGWDPLDISSVYDEDEDGNTKEGFYWDAENEEWFDDFSPFIDEWVEDSWDDYSK